MHNLKTHFKTKHSYLTTCPICNKYVKYLVSHCIKKYQFEKCEKHLALYYLTSNPYKLKDIYKLARDTAEKLFKIENIKINKLCKCPVCGEHVPFDKLRNHYMSKHDTSYCYICNKRFKILAQHCSFKNDEDHLILYYLASRTRYYQQLRKIKEAEKITLKKLAID